MHEGVRISANREAGLNPAANVYNGAGKKHWMPLYKRAIMLLRPWQNNQPPRG